jgi:uncharacterized MAPEG superfamily protein
MTTDLICLLILALWSIPLNHIPALARMFYSDVNWGLSNREKMPDVPPWVKRADRAQRNHHDNLAAIATVILIAQITGKADAVTAWASIAIVVFRLLHGITYIFGITIVRSLAYFGALTATIAIVLRLFS